MTKTTKTGAEKIRWNLSDLYSSITDKKIDADLKKTIKDATNFEKKYKGNLSTLSIDNLNKAYIELEKLLTPIYKVSQYVGLEFAVDTNNDDIKQLVSKVDEIESQVSNHLVFFDLELGDLPEKTYKEALNSKSIKNYRYSLQRSKETKKYNLSEAEEKLINLKDLTGEDAFKKLYTELTSSFKFEFKVDGKLKTLNGSELRALRQHKDPKVRRDAMKLFFKKYEDHQLTLTHLYNNILKSYNIEKKLRGYKSSIERRNVQNDLTNKSVEILHKVTKNSAPLVNRYYKLKAKLLGLKKLTLADIYAPLPEDSHVYSYDEAKSIVLEGFKKFDKEIYDLAKLMFDENRIDAPVTPTKRGGAFCSGSTPDIKPYVLLNFLGRSRDIATMAHELGHAIHDMLSSKQTLINFHPILPLAETASVFSEMIITDHLLKNEKNPKVRMSILTDKLEDIFATSHRQNMFSSFEIETHKEISENLLSSKDICKIYKTHLHNMFGDSIDYTDEYQWEWAAIPHIFEWPFYVYAYNFGNLLVISLYQKYLEEGDTFIPKFKNFLSMGSSTNPIEITKLVGVDINSEAFWASGFKWIEGLIDELEKIVNSKN